MITVPELLLRLFLALVLGGLVGLERERKEWVAGLRTHMLVCLGSALAIIVSAYGFAAPLTMDHVELDPSRIASQVISGIGFLGAGTIMFYRQRVVRGLTTAAGLWAVAAIGLAIGAGLYIAGIAGTILVLVILGGVQFVERRVFSRRTYSKISVLFDISVTNLGKIEDLLAKHGLSYASLMVSPTPSQNVNQAKIRLAGKLKKENILQILDELARIDGIKEAQLGDPF